MTVSTHPSASVVNFSGPYGVGKDSLLLALSRELQDRAWRVGTITTRPVSGDFDPSYRSLDDAQFDEAIAQGRWLINSQIGGRFRYGTSLDEIHDATEAGKVALLSVYAGPQGGAGRLREVLGWRLISLGLLATIGSEDAEIAELSRRLRTRGREDAATIDSRLPSQREKIAYVQANPVVQTPDGPMKAFDHVIINDNLARAEDELLSLMVDAGILPGLRHAV